MHVDDIRSAMDRGDLAEIEAGFRALAGREDDVTGAADQPALMELLQSVCVALSGDDRTMPRDVADLIQAEAGDVMRDRTYAGGSTAVRMNTVRWRGLLKQWFTTEQEEGR